MPPADATCAHCTRDRTESAQASPGALWWLRSQHTGAMRVSRGLLPAASPSPASWGSARPPLASGVATPQESDLASRAYATREVIME